MQVILEDVKKKESAMSGTLALAVGTVSEGVPLCMAAVERHLAKSEVGVDAQASLKSQQCSKGK